MELIEWVDWKARHVRTASSTGLLFPRAVLRSPQPDVLPFMSIRFVRALYRDVTWQPPLLGPLGQLGLRTYAYQSLRWSCGKKRTTSGMLEAGKHALPPVLTSLELFHNTIQVVHRWFQSTRAHDRYPLPRQRFSRRPSGLMSQPAQIATLVTGLEPMQFICSGF
jgi:hypothetical protein